MSAPPRRAFTRPWTFLRSSRRSAEKHVLLSGEYKLPKTDLILTPTRDRCQSCETNAAHLSYDTLVQREATPGRSVRKTPTCRRPQQRTCCITTRTASNST